MNRTTVALLAALDAVIVAAIGLGIVLVPLTVLWAAQFHLAVDWSVFWRAASDIWLAGHGVNLTVTLSATTAASLGFAQATAPFQLTIAVLGFAMLTMLMGGRTGVRAAESEHPLVGVVSAVVAFGLIGTIVTLTAAAGPVRPSLWQGIVLPAFVFGLGIVIGAGIGLLRMRASRAPGATPLPWLTDRLSDLLGSGVGAALRTGTAAAALVLAAAGVLVAVLLITRFGTVVGLYEQLQAGFLGATALTIAELALLPNTVVWTASWLSGPGFAIGTGSSVSPIGTQLGPIPSFPLLGILPQGSVSLGFLGLLVPVLAGFGAALLMRRRLARRPEGAPSAGRMALIALGAGCIAGIEIGLLAWWSSGAIGPGRLHDAGPIAWKVGLAVAVTVAIPAVIGMLSGGVGRSGGRMRAADAHFSKAP